MPTNQDPIKNRLEELFSANSVPNDRYTQETGEYSPITIQAELDEYSTITKVNSDQLHDKRVRELNCLNEIGFRIDERPSVPEFLEWVSRLIPTALFFPEIGTAAITYYDKTYGDDTAVHLSNKIVAGIRIAGNLIGYIHVAYREPRHFADEESAFLGAVTGRITGYLENQFLFAQMEKRSEALVKFKKGIDLANDAVFITDKDGKITYVNEAFEKTYGYSQSEAIGNTPRIIKSGLIPQEQYKYFWKTLLSGEVVSGELVNKTKTGQLISIDGANIPILDDHDEILGYLAIHRDISEQKHDKTLVTKRASDLEAVAQLSTTISAILDPDRLLQTVVDLSKDMFDLYHAHIYLFDLNSQELSLAAGSGETGRKMVQRNWSIQLSNENSIVAKAAREKQGLLSNDIKKAATFLENPFLPDTNSELSVPIIVRDQVLGVLDVQSEKPDFFSQEDISIQTALAGQIAVALQNARQYQETQNALAHTETLLQLSQASSGSLESKEILSQTLSKIIDVTGYTTGLISILNPLTNTLEIAVHHNLPDRLLEHIINKGLGGTLCEFVFKNNETLVIEDLSKGAPMDVSGLQTLGLKSYYGLPLLSQDSSVGTLCLFSNSLTPRNDQLDKFLMVASHQLGIAFGNSILFEQTQMALNQSEALYQGSQKIIEATSVQELLDAVITFSPAERFDRAYLLTFDNIESSSQPEHIIISAKYEKPGMADGFNVQEVFGFNDLGLDVLADPENPIFTQNIELDIRIKLASNASLIDQLNARSVAVFPLTVSKNFYGVIMLLAQEEMSLNQQDIRQIFSLVRQSGTMLHNIQLRGSLEDQLGEMEVLQRMMSREAWSAYLLQYDEGQLGYVYDQVEARAISSIDMVNLENGNGRSQSKPDPFSMPLMVQGEQIGGLGVQTNADQDISQDEEFYLHSIAEQLSQALERARLIEQSQKTALELQTVAQVSATSSTVLDPEELLQSVVNLAKNSFGMYHAHIYLFDKDESKLVLTSGAGEVGRQMVKEGWIIFIDDDSIVAEAARTREGQIVNDVRETPDFLPNPLLPNTVSELAVPMIVGNQVLGVFDVQSDRINSFTENDLQTFSTLATQTSVALQNARLFEEQSMTVERLRELDHLKTSFLANMSHELRTPLNSILGFTQVILEGIDGPLTDYMVSDLQLIEKNGKHLLHLINEVLDMAKIESGRMSLTIETVDLNELLAEILETTSAQARDKNLYLDLETDPQENLVINADLIRIKQVMLNLVGNAIKFTESGGVSVNAVRQAESINIHVIDTGIGIPSDKLETIFEAFSQVDTSTTRKAGGTGLGLPISRRLVELHGGKLWAESAGEGKGTIMQITLPVNAEAD